MKISRASHGLASPVDRRFLIGYQLGEGSLVVDFLYYNFGGSGPVLLQQCVDNYQVPVEEKVEWLLVEAAKGQNIGGGTHNTAPLEIHMGKQVSDIKFEVLNVPCGKKEIYGGFLPMYWLVQHNPDIEWAKGSMREGLTTAKNIVYLR
jgi:hypothetical protein